MARKEFFAYLFITVLLFSIIVIIFASFSYFRGYVFHIVLSLGSLLIANQLSKRYLYERKISPVNKAVLITGCDSGFGHQLAKRLQSKGFTVFAGCLFPDGSGAKELQETCSHLLKVLPLDVRSDESVADALKFVRENLGSSGRIPMIECCPYMMSKHAVVALSECLCMEMAAWGVRVISIEPEAFRTPIIDLNALFSRMRAERKEIDKNIVLSYGEKYFDEIEKMI